MVDSFAVELYLKCLYVIDRKEAPHGHDWREIFDALKDFTRSECRATYQRDLEASPVPMLVRSGINPGAAKVLSFDEVLDAGRNTFDKRRCLYEQPATHGWFYTHFMRNAIRKVAKMDIENAKVAKTLRGDLE